MSGPRRSPWVLALHPFTRGVAYAFFQEPLSLLDGGIKRVRGKQKNALALQLSHVLIEHFQPDAVVLGVSDDPHVRRSKRVRRLMQLIATHASGEGYVVHTFTRQEVRDCFKSAGAATRYEIAQVIAGQIRALARHLPRARKPWETEDARMSRFDAASLAMTFYCRQVEAQVDGIGNE